MPEWMDGSEWHDDDHGSSETWEYVLLRWANTSLAQLEAENARLREALEIEKKKHLDTANWAEEQQERANRLEAENALLQSLVLLHGHLPSCPQFTGPYDLGELEPACNCGFDCQHSAAYLSGEHECQECGEALF
jgi:hypothetical protein